MSLLEVIFRPINSDRISQLLAGSSYGRGLLRPLSPLKRRGSPPAWFWVSVFAFDFSLVGALLAAPSDDLAVQPTLRQTGGLAHRSMTYPIFTRNLSSTIAGTNPFSDPPNRATSRTNRELK